MSKRLIGDLPMCRCTPTIRTPFCGKPGCHANPPTEIMPIHDLPARLEHQADNMEREGHLNAARYMREAAMEISQLRLAVETEWQWRHEAHCTCSKSCTSFGGKRRCLAPRPAVLG